MAVMSSEIKSTCFSYSPRRFPRTHATVCSIPAASQNVAEDGLGQLSRLAPPLPDKREQAKSLAELEDVGSEIRTLREERAELDTCFAKQLSPSSTPAEPAGPLRLFASARAASEAVLDDATPSLLAVPP